MPELRQNFLPQFYRPQRSFNGNPRVRVIRLRRRPAVHWYVSGILRLTRVAGFELGSGMFSNTVLPEAAAEFLRNVSAEKSLGAAR